MNGAACSAHVMLRCKCVPTIVLPGFVSSGWWADVWNTSRLMPWASQ